MTKRYGHCPVCGKAGVVIDDAGAANDCSNCGSKFKLDVVQGPR